MIEIVSTILLIVLLAGGFPLGLILVWTLALWLSFSLVMTIISAGTVIWVFSHGR